MQKLLIFISSLVRKYRGLLLSLLHERGRWHHTLKFYVKVFFYVMGKALSGELCCMGTGLVSIKKY